MNDFPVNNHSPQQKPQKATIKNIWGWYKRQRNISKLGIGCGALVILIMSCFICTAAAAGIGGSSHPTTTTTQTTPTAIPIPTNVAHKTTSTPTQTAKPTPTPAVSPPAMSMTSTTSSSTDTTLGQPLSNFEAKYGTPDNTSKYGDYNFGHMLITVQAFTDKDPNKNRASGILYAGPDKNGWSNMENATKDCRLFLPSDAKYKRTTTGTNDDIQRVYISQSLANWFPASDFTDEKGNTTTPGTIAIVYSPAGNNTNTIVSCAIQVGLEGN